MPSRTPTRTATLDPVLPYISQGARSRLSFDEVLSIIAGDPRLVSIFIGNNIRFADDPQNYNQPADVTYRLGSGDCEDFAQFACAALYAGEWSYAAFDNAGVNSAAGLDVQWGTPTPDGRFPRGHAVCLYRRTGGHFLFLDNRGVIKGPFDSAEQAIQRIAEENGIDISLVVGTGPDSRIVKEDILRAIEEATKEAKPVSGEQTLAMTSMKETILARRNKVKWKTLQVRKELCTTLNCVGSSYC